MVAMQKPAMDSLAAMAKGGGPKDDQEWAKAQLDAVVLGETAQLILLANRPLDQDLWIKSSEKLFTNAGAASKAAEAKDMAAWKTALNNMGSSCRACHNVHRKKQQ
jgi:cytochrome c556